MAPAVAELNSKVALRERTFFGAWSRTCWSAAASTHAGWVRFPRMQGKSWKTPIRRGLRLVLVATGLALGIAAPAAAQAPSYPDAVVLVSGYTTSTPFTTPDPACNGKEGGTWGIAGGPAAALKAAGFAVFTAPITNGADPIPLPCPGSGVPLPDSSMSIDSFGDNDKNGAAFGSFLAFLRDNYGVRRVQLVAHSDGGNWSRAAITQSAAFSGLEIRSLTTLGTPYTGSMIADIGIELHNGQCDFTDTIEQDLCLALLDIVDVVVKNGGPTTIEQLTHTYLEAWNPEQSIGACPVTTIAGTGLELPLVPFTYYNPSDGLVGEASGLAQSADEIPTFQEIPAPAIPNLQSGGTFPVVHSPTLAFIRPQNLLNTPAISAKVTAVVQGTPAGGVPCNSSPPGATETQKLGVPLKVNELPDDDGMLPRPGALDVVLIDRGRVRCGQFPVPAVPLIEDERLAVGIAQRCGRRLRVSGKRPRVMMVHSRPPTSAQLTVTGRRVTVDFDGPDPKNVRLAVADDGRTRSLKLDAKGRGRLPADDDSTTLVVKARLAGRKAVGAGVVAR